MNTKYWFVIFFLVATIYSCSKEAVTTDEVWTGFQTPSNFPAPLYNFSDNAITKEGFELGRKLFYDPILSANNTISCGSCHIQTSAFTQHGHSVSHGIYDRNGTRNSPPIMNLAWSSSFMWDGGVFNLDLQPIAPITSHVEMDDSVVNVLARLRNSNTYKAMFKKAFGSEEITSERFLKSLSQFMLMCVSSNSKYDSVQRGQATFTADQNAGYLLVKQKCGSCHKEPLFTDNSFRNNGLTPSTLDDKGRYAVTLVNSDKYKFKVPSLRNLDYTSPYMHDGRFFTLDGVLDHYNSGVQLTPNLDTFFTQTTSPGIALTTSERASILAFLQTLNDRSFLLDRCLSEQ